MAESVCTWATADQQFLQGNYKMRDYNNQPPGGRGRLRALLASIGENAEERLTDDPRYKEGFDEGFEAGYAAAQANHRQLTKAIADVYRIEAKGNE